MVISLPVLLRMRNAVEKIKTYIVLNIFPENLTFYEIMWKNTVEAGGHRRQYIPAQKRCDNQGKDTNTLSQYLMLIAFAFPRQQWLREGTSIFCYTCIASLLPS